MNYKIGDVSRMLGISADLLRYYEKKGVVHPRKDEKNGYRYYDARDIDLLIDCLWFKNYDFSMEQIAGLVSGSDYETLYSELTAKEAELEMRLQMQQRILGRLRTHLEELRRGRETLGVCDVAERPEVWYFMNRRDLTYDDGPFPGALTQDWLKCMPFVRRCFEIRQEDLPGRGGNGAFSWGLAITPKYAREFGLDSGEPVLRLPPCRCVHSVFKSAGRTWFSREHLRYITDYASENGLTICGNAFGALLFSVLEGGGETDYFEVWIPVE